jgi:hypothetical protein
MFSNNLLMAAASISAGGYEVDYSCRFHGTDSTYLAFTPSSTATNTKIGTLSVWVKLALDTTVNNQILNAGGSSGDIIKFDQSNFKIESFLNNYSSGRYITTQVFRDPHAWGHLVLALDTNSTTAVGDRMRIYWNGEEITAFGTETHVSDDYALLYGKNGTEQVIGNKTTPGTDYQFGGYMAEYVYIDGQQLTPSSFGETDDNDIWRPIDVSGLTFGNNGYYLDFADDSDLGNDVSGKNNDFTSSSGLADVDQVIDTPTNNFAIISPLGKQAGLAISDGNLKGIGDTSGQDTMAPTSIVASTGMKVYCEFVATGANTMMLGVIKAHEWGANFDVMASDSMRLLHLATGDVYTSDGVVLASNYAPDDSVPVTIMIALDLVNDKIYWGDAGTDKWSDGAGSYDQDFTASPGGVDLTADLAWLFTMRAYSSTFVANFGQHSFVGTPPSGFLALNTTNLPVPSIADPSAQFQPNTRTGNGDAGAVTQTGNSQFGTDLIIIKNRDETDSWKVVDTGRGATYQISTDTVDAQTQDSNGVTDFSDTNGYIIGTGADGYNDDTENFIDYHFQEGSTPGMGINASVSHEQGSETEIAHGMNLVPAFAMVKETDAATAWWIFHQKLTSETARYLILGGTDATDKETTLAAVWGTQSSTNFVIGNAETGLADGTYVCYSFAEVAGFSNFGSYKGNGVPDGSLVLMDFKPAFIIIKNIDADSTDWQSFDTQMNKYNVAPNRLAPNGNYVEATTSSNQIDILSNGFKIRSSHANMNSSDTDYIYCAWAENPFGGEGGTFGSGVSPATAR